MSSRVPLDKVVRKGKHKQLLVKLIVTGEDVKETPIEVLVDTGAQINLIKKGIIPNYAFRPAKKPFTLMAANGGLLPGGQQEVKLDLTFMKVSGDTTEPQEWRTTASFYEADIPMDAILGYPWLARMDLGVFTHPSALAFEHPDRGFVDGKAKKVL